MSEASGAPFHSSTAPFPRKLENREETKTENRSTEGLSEWESGKVIELDARVLARQCLKEVGKEMGVGW